MEESARREIREGRKEGNREEGKRREHEPVSGIGPVLSHPSVSVRFVARGDDEGVVCD